jgi:recombination protein RecA
VGDLLDLAVAEEIVTKRGAFFSYGDTRLGQGRENAKSFLTENPHLTTELDGLVRSRHGLSVVLAPKAESAPRRLADKPQGEIGDELAVAP